MLYLTLIAMDRSYLLVQRVQIICQLCNRNSDNVSFMRNSWIKLVTLVFSPLIYNSGISTSRVHSIKMEFDPLSNNLAEGDSILRKRPPFSSQIAHQIF
ncbi:hypothetical protein QL285_015975 [Trifolium repens]|nr:hypothetical protein QL285_015975 [Trifolium repens]